MKGEGSVIYTLRIKKVYFDRIASGDKVKEYRNYIPFYSGLEHPNLKYISFHYQGGIYLLTELKSVQAIKTPARLKHSPIAFGPKVYEISLGKVIELYRK